MKKIISAGLLTLVTSCSPPQVPCHKVNSETALAQCLVDEGVLVYTAEYCSSCEKQKVFFGEAWETMKKNEINCGNYIGFALGKDRLQLCIDDKIEAYPTWVFGDKRLSGFLKLDQFKYYSVCEYK